jgi:hypothetical protein
MPVSQETSVAEAKLVLLAIERRRRLTTEVVSDWSSSSEWLWRAFVNNDSCCSLGRRREVRLN